MADKAIFWKGVSAGLLAGMGIAVALRYLPVERMLGASHLAPHPHVDEHGFSLETMRADEVATQGDAAAAADDKLPSLAMPDSMAASVAISSFFSKRDQPESAGDPATLASARTGVVATFLRTGGAPGGRLEAEFLEVPGRPGERIDHIDLSKPVRVYPRSLDIGSSG